MESSGAEALCPAYVPGSSPGAEMGQWKSSWGCHWGGPPAPPAELVPRTPEVVLTDTQAQFRPELPAAPPKPAESGLWLADPPTARIHPSGPKGFSQKPRSLLFSHSPEAGSSATCPQPEHLIHSFRNTPTSSPLGETIPRRVLWYHFPAAP